MLWDLLYEEEGVCVLARDDDDDDYEDVSNSSTADHHHHPSLSPEAVDGDGAFEHAW